MTLAPAGRAPRSVTALALMILVPTAGLLAWTVAIRRTAYIMLFVSAERRDVWLLDWHVYAAGARDLLDGTLYRTSLVYPGQQLPVADFNLPPMAAAWATPLIWMPHDMGGVVWLALGLIVWILSWWLLATQILHLPYAWVWVGIAFAAYSQFAAFDIHVSVGNINDLMLGLMAAFVLLHARGHAARAGLVLGLATATKIWPAALMVLLARERRWRELAWSVGTLLVTTTALVSWLGLSVIPDLVQDLRTTVSVAENNPVLWTTWMREHIGWWPAWGAVLVALVVLAIPGRGLPGIGLAMLAGITVIPNIWGHYLPTLIFAGGLVFTAALNGPRWSRSIAEPQHRAGPRPFTDHGLSDLGAE